MRGNRLFRFLDYCVGIPLLWILSRFGKANRAVAPSSPKNILVIKLVALGDSILLVPALRGLKTRFPHAKITLVGTSLTHEFLHLFPEYIADVILIDTAKILKRPGYLPSLIRRIKEGGFDLVIDFEQWVRLTGILVRLSGLRPSVGFRTKHQHRHAAYDVTIGRLSVRHEVENFLALVSAVTGMSQSSDLEVKIDPVRVRDVGNMLKERGRKESAPILVLHPGCGSHGFPREWSPERYRKVARELSRQFGIFTVVTGVRTESRLVEQILEGNEFAGSSFMIERLEDFIALLSQTALFISSNNGAMHLAAAVGIQQIALHGPTNSVQWGPVNKNAHVIRSQCPGCPCLDLGAEYHRTDGYCMEQISIEVVLEAARKMLSGIHTPPGAAP